MQYKYIVLLNTSIAGVMALLDSNIVLIALPTIIRDLPGTTAATGIWVMMGYVLILATSLLAFGRLGDIHGRIRLYTLGFVVFTLGSGLCSISPNGVSLVLFRLIQGIGGALIFANNTAIITDAFPPTERGRAIGINQIAGIAASGVGLVLGGILTAYLGWRSVFWINLPIGGFATVWAYTKLKELSVPSRGEGPDPLGMGLFGIGLTACLLGLTLGSVSGWRLLDVGIILAGFSILACFVYAEGMIRNPMMDLSLLRIRAFSAGMISNLLASVARGAVSLVLVFYFQGSLGLDPLAAGLRLIPFVLAFVSLGPISGFLSDKYGSRGFSTAGLIVSATAFIWFATLPGEAPYEIFVMPMILAGAGGGLFVAPNVASIMNSVPVMRRGVASGMTSTLVSTGFLLSLGISFAMMATSMPLSTLKAIFAGLPVQAGGVNAELFVSSMHEIFIFMAALSLIGALPSALRGPKTV